MRLASLRLQNFRAFEDETITFNEYMCLVGPNGGGKSTVLTALNIVFQYKGEPTTNVTTLDREDFHHKNVTHPVTITATFKDLSSEAQADFSGITVKGSWSSQQKRNGVRITRP